MSEPPQTRLPELGAADLPGRVQVTFVPAEGAFAWWGVPDLAVVLAAHRLPVGREGRFRCAVPIGVGGSRAVAAALVQARFVSLGDSLSALRSLRPADDVAGELGASVWSWREAAQLTAEPAAGAPAAFTELAARMPAAAHAALDVDPAAIETAAAVLSRFRAAAEVRGDLESADIRATLRPYQVEGVAWLRSLAPPLGGKTVAEVDAGVRDSPGGGVLADEMGLGKTLQAICLLATRRCARPHLVVAPTSVVGNWCRELARFAPETPVIAHHGSRRRLAGPPPAGTVVVTSYSVLRSDVALLTGIDWDVVVFDEAQQLKNPDTRGAKAAADLPAVVRVAMTGTPVENRLDELWAILHITNPGLLGTRGRFRQRFAVPIEQRRSSRAAARLSALVEPHVLRRRKAEVAADLPPKMYATVACTLTEEQAGLYRQAVSEAFDEGLGTGFGRRGRVLALLTALKQICNHPAQFRPDDRGLAGRSGKFDRITEMLTEIVDEDDRALVFTQYRAMGELLSTHLSAQLGVETVPFLHGGLSLERRDELVRSFQHDENGPPVLLLSLRAAGFGLNLTRAGHVVHYDRWWNPAVEEQATDRAHRIGRDRPLAVHTLVTAGTIEDHIARMHESKRVLAGVVGGGEAALAELSDEDLRAVLTLDEGVIG
ncbi:DEAD/DEAH box helicase [Actinoalloteichus hymeniacidonis]|uniref:Helicase family protein n=1 Tax=Actinoalloteichus hymeniacidonis TaxID=340345 RepID=A0AAC9MZ25_9PSEU|nr:DEAD/DEAH box helicase [Actinoalloteichus hymeniacidonis]AOS63617.1 helicase family protein [Actinoalloteichus hymeniacidonis]MBB5908335.1 SNF2 family DNA or RNA helicase [Actinoalloteichus hymeniacidonis]